MIHRKAFKGVAAATVAGVLAAAQPAAAQFANTPFGGFRHNASQPLDIAADNLNVDNAANSAVFSGNVLVIQGKLRLQADRLEVQYAPRGSQSATGVERLRASGDVLMTNGAESASSRRLDYNVAGGVIVLQGSVLLAQRENVVKTRELRVNVNSGRALLSGGVQAFSGGRR